jgi:peptidoglycan/xylan/chitin deacetylase (PgdA/CDA1 family)
MKKFIALTFDDGPSEHTTRILNTLEKHNVPATFFVQGNHIEGGREIIKRAFRMGCEIANHSWTHPNLTLATLSADEIKKELLDTSDALEKITGTRPQIFRPPYGAFNDALKTVCAETNLPIINWSVDPLDWEHKNADKICEIVFAKLHEGAIVLSHDMYSSTADAYEQIIPRLILDGFTLVTVSELMRVSNVKLEPGVVYDNG